MSGLIDVSTYGILRPEKVRWVFPSGYGDPLEGIRSDSLRKFLSTYETVLSQEHIKVWYGPLRQEQWDIWYPFYQEHMREHSYDVLAPKNLLEIKTSENKQTEALFFISDEKLLAGGIIIRQDTSWSSLAYKASIRIAVGNKQNSSLGAILDYVYLKTMHGQGVQLITGGRSRNSFGVVNTFGQAEYKLRLGYTPHIDVDCVLENTIDMMDKNAVLFVGVRNEHTTLFLLKEKDVAIDTNFSKFTAYGIAYEEILL